MLQVARRAESGPWESVWVYDHFHTVPQPTDQVTHEAWTLMAALAATTDRIRLGQMCTCLSYRNPAYLAKVVGTPEQIVETLTKLQSLGMTYAITYFVDAACDTSSFELFEREVVSALR